MKELTGHVYPTTEPSPLNASRFVRRWIVRTRRSLPNDLSDAARCIVEKVGAIVRDAYGSSASDEEIAHNLPALQLARGDELHLVAAIEVAAPDTAVGDAPALATWRILGEIDLLYEIDDLQGIPRRFWFQLNSA